MQGRYQVKRVVNGVLQSLIIILCSVCSKHEDVIKIGAILPLSGDGAKYGSASMNAINLALAEINQELQENRIMLYFEDSKGIAKDAVSALQKMMTQINPVAIIGDLYSSNVLAMAPIAENNKIILHYPSHDSVLVI